MQISSKLFNQQQVNQFSEINSELQSLQGKISSGKNILVASDDPVRSVELSGMKVVKEQIDQYIKNVDTSDSRMKNIDVNLENLTSLMVRANELMIQASSDVLGASDREAIAIEMDQLKEQAFGLANQQDSSGVFLFSGYKSKVQPFIKDISGNINYRGDRGVTSLAVSESMVVETNLDGGSLFQNIKVGSNKPISMFTLFENMSNSIRTAAQAVYALEAPTSAEIEITNNNYGNWSFDITGNDGTASISSELIGDDPIDIITKINLADIGITASFSENEGKIKLVSNQEGLIKIENLEIEGIDNAQKSPTSFITLNATDSTGSPIGRSQTLYDANQLTSSQLNNISETQVHIANFRGKVGARLNLLERQKETLNERDIAIQKDMSKIGDADLAKLVTEMQSMMTSLQASQQAFVKISNLNLFEFIR
ncbi:flagellar hook-associated protein FlgL [bacterium]|jgi:flagellar hook-associated protein 3 FlgL|nr:flagellar hook-associated protein FlgL [bacterium]